MRTHLAAISCLLGIALAAPVVRAQGVQWAKRMGDISYDQGSGITVDGNGNTYVTGAFNETAYFGSYNLTSAGSFDIFVAKLGVNGFVQWAKRMGGALSDYSSGITVDTTGNTYVTGYFSGTADFGPYNLTPVGGADIFVTKLDSNGTIQWAKPMGGMSEVFSSDIMNDGNGNTYVTGSFTGTADFGSYSLTSAGFYDVFVTKLNSSGTVQWATHMGGEFGEIGYGIAVDGGGNAYVTGEFSGTADFGSYSLTSAGSDDIFVSKLDINGIVQWAKRMGGTTPDLGESIAVDGGGNAYATGNFSGTADFGAYSLTSVGMEDIFVTKIDSSGTVQWVRPIGIGGNGVQVNGIAVDGNGNTYVTGYFYGTAGFGSYSLTSAGWRDIFVTKLNSNGTVQWAERMGGISYDSGAGIAVDGDGNTYVTGSFEGTADFGSYSLTSAGFIDIFVAKLSGIECLDTDGNGDPDNDKDGLCDNWESAGIDSDADGLVDLELYDVDQDGEIEPGERAHIDIPDVYVEVDWMEGHKPRKRALEKVEQAFLSNGVRLHVQRDEEASPQHELLYWCQFSNVAPAPTAADFDQVKESHFGTESERSDQRVLDAKNLAFHYSLFVDSMQSRNSNDPLSIAGYAELPGNDFIVTLGGFELPWTSWCVRCEDKQASVFMHELGHNLGLTHSGGPDGHNCKPNYISVMNYLYSYEELFLDPWVQVSYVSDRRITYSHGLHRTLKEDELDEAVGIGSVGDERIAFGPQPNIQENVDASGPIDWSLDDHDSDGDPDNDDLTGEFYDISCVIPGTCCEQNPVPQELVDHDDWGNLDFEFRASQYFDPPPCSSSSRATRGFLEDDLDELTLEKALEVARDADGDGIADIVDGCPTVPDPDQLNDDLDQSGDACDCAPADPLRYRNAVEANDGIDNQCPGDPGFGLVDEIQFAYLTDPFKIEYRWFGQEGATGYEVARATRPEFVDCDLETVTDSAWQDPEIPSSGQVYFYLVRAGAPNIGSWGAGSGGEERVRICSDEIAVINFQPDASDVPEGYDKDWGQLFDAGLEYGWNMLLLGNTRDRELLPDQALDTLIFSQVPRRWDLSVVDGVYVVWVTSGDAGFEQGPQQVAVEGLPVVSGEMTAPGSFLVTAACVRVADGDLTIEIGGLAGNTILNSVRVELDSCAPGTILEQEIVTP